MILKINVSWKCMVELLGYGADEETAIDSFSLKNGEHLVEDSFKVVFDDPFKVIPEVGELIPVEHQIEDAQGNRRDEVFHMWLDRDDIEFITSWTD